MKTKLWRIVAAAGLVLGLQHDPARSEVIPATPPARTPIQQYTAKDHGQPQDLGRRWYRNISSAMKIRYCDFASGEEIGWLMSPLLNGFYYAYLATGDRQWIDRLVDWTDSWVRRGVVEPDGYIGWPKFGAAGTDVDDLNTYYADSLVGEAMALTPVVLMSAVILHEPGLKFSYGRKADSYIRLARSTFDKWNSRGAWRTNGDTIISVALPFGIDRRTGGWTEGYQIRNAMNLGFSHPDNKANLVASWLLAMFDATGDTQYKDRADGWFRLMKSRIHIAGDGTYQVWNYWEPAGPWDYSSDGTPKHWIGIHPNAGYYAIDVNAIVEAYQHSVQFTSDDVKRLIETASVRSTLWPALVPYDAAMKQRFDRSLDPDGWAEIVLIPEYLAPQTPRAD